MHPEYKQSASTNFNIMLLETLVLLRSHQQSSSFNDPGLLRLPNHEVAVNALQETKEFLCRRKLVTASPDNGAQILLGKNDPNLLSIPGPVKTMNDFLCHGWAQRDPFKILQGSGHRTFPLFRALVRFMILSARISQAVSKSANKSWMGHACKMMLHAALEAADGSDVLGSNIPGPEFMLVQPGVLECFAFKLCTADALKLSEVRHRTTPTDHLDSPRSASFPIDSAVQEEERAISEMFSQAAEIWDGERQRYLSELALPTLENSSDEESNGHDEHLLDLIQTYRSRLGRLRRKYPLQQMLAGVVEVLENLFAVNNSPTYGGKPVLVQIEEGGLDDMAPAEFAVFKEKIGLDRDANTKEIGHKTIP
jgi:hypothetical protein